MPKNELTSEHPMRQAEDAALNTYREWPVLLVLRQKELQSHLAPSDTEPTSPPKSTQPQSDEKHKE